jgi:hypothetical protein
MLHFMTSIMAGTFAAGLMASGLAWAQNPVGAASAFEFGGRPHCWYSDGSHGDGWYRCGYAHRYGWGGEGWHRWHPTGPRYPTGDLGEDFCWDSAHQALQDNCNNLPKLTAPQSN